MTKKEIKKAVKANIKYLKSIDKWEVLLEKFDENTFDLASQRRCILGFIYGHACDSPYTKKLFEENRTGLNVKTNEDICFGYWGFPGECSVNEEEKKIIKNYWIRKINKAKENQQLKDEVVRLTKLNTRLLREQSMAEDVINTLRGKLEDYEIAMKNIEESIQYF